MNEKPFYNSALIDNYIKLLKAEYPHINIDDVLASAKIEPWELDPGHWFTQSKANNFHKIILEKTGNKDIARDAGRFSVANRANNIMRQAALSLLSPSNLYDILGKISKKYSKAINVKSKKISNNRHEIITEFLKGVTPEKYQCDNMIGYLEAVYLVFQSKLPKIEHSECYFNNGKRCKYIISWKKSVSERIVRFRNTSIIILVPAIIILFIIKINFASVLATASLFYLLFMTLLSLAYEKKELLNIVRKQDFKPYDVLDHHNRYHRSANLIKDISIALSKTKTIQDILLSIENILHALAYQSGVIALIDYSKNKPTYSDIYHYHENQRGYLQELKNKEVIFKLSDNEISKPILKAKRKIIDQLPVEIRNLLLDIGINSAIYLPMVFEKTLLGFIIVNTLEESISASDLFILHSIASQSALSMANIKFNETLMASEKVKKEFVTVASHELLTPIQIITFAIDDIKIKIKKSGGYKNDLSNSIDILDQSVKKLGSISKKILDFKKIEADINLKPISIDKIINTLKSESQYILTSSKHTIKYEIKNKIKLINCDETTFDQLLCNLIENAAKYTPENGKIKVMFDLNQAELLIFIEDNGIGIEKEHHEQIFMPFYQIKKDKTGAGMGLSFCQEVAKKHEGYITLESPIWPEKTRKGTRFIVHLPADKAIVSLTEK